ncbi:toll/interleukin-1 receptor domain-containing protein [Candidatus Entotheonella palauensis]|uniref:TIR domain-containing protein n=1 Tax=Candidatus Entotheonella gemina TaxID=1429439 RepID=W4M1Q2_9BACT|nr:toll/interleukin-1 receptor domain-containing protein [Candidatus Entotheonella palauensis]ETX03861.1 MAG: hypothetical protein ETSY2_32195 [Candidatus Entotheonella gemina]
MNAAQLKDKQFIEQRPRIFLNYASEDKCSVYELYERLREAGCEPWMDNRDIVGGRRWKANIDRTIHNSHFFLACLSVVSADKKGWIEKERAISLELQKIFPPDIPYLIPVCLESCHIPQNLSVFQSIDLFAKDGFGQLCKALEMGMQQSFPLERAGSSGQSVDDRSILIQGTIVLPIYPLMGINVSARLYAGNTETFVHPQKGEELEAMWKIKFPVNERTAYDQGVHHPMYDLGFMFPGGHLFSSRNGFVIPASWPFTDEDVRLGTDITAQLSLTFKYDGTLTVRRRRR